MTGLGDHLFLLLTAGTKPNLNAVFRTGHGLGISLGQHEFMLMRASDHAGRNRKQHHENQ